MNIGIVGLAGAGKDTLAGLLRNELALQGQEYILDSYAAPIKELTANVFGVDLDTLEDRKFKESTHRVDKALMDNAVYTCINGLYLTPAPKFKMCDSYKSNTTFAAALDKHGELLISPRTFMQQFGTNVVRAHVPDYWVNALKRRNTNAIVTDVRFPNELLDANILVLPPDYRRTKMNHLDGKGFSRHTSEEFAWSLTYGGLIILSIDAVIPNWGSIEDLGGYAKDIAQVITNETRLLGD